MSDNLEFLDGDSPAEPQVVSETPQPEASQADGPARGPDGKFAPKSEAAPEPAPQPTPVQPEPVAAQPKADQPPPGYVPVSVVQELRQEIKALKQPAPAPQPPPDRYADPDGYEAYREQQEHDARLNLRLDLSEEMARVQHGDNLVDTARDWAIQQFQNRPAFYAEVISQRNPYGYVVAQYQRDQMISQVTPDEFAKYQAWKSAQAQAQAGAPLSPQSPPAPPRSLANASSAGGGKPGDMPTHEGSAFEATFKG